MGKYDFVISYTGTPLGKVIINRIVRKYAKLLKVKEIQPKGLKHSRASLLINELNANPVVSQKKTRILWYINNIRNLFSSISNY